MAPGRETEPASDGQDGQGESVVAIVLARSTDTVQTVEERFAEAGFTVGPASGPTFSIQAPAATFESAFGERPVHADDGGWTTGQGDEMPLTALADDLQHELVAVAFERPVELHDEGDG
ncbi:hypothetical protein [Ornithinimicrobium sp. LYQ103]